MRVILNPTAGNGAGRRLRPAIERELRRQGLAVDLVQTRGAGHATELAAEAANTHEAVVAAGGDGTVHEVVNGLLDNGAAQCALGLIPVGTGNDFVKLVPGASSLTAAVATLKRGCRMPFDVGRARWSGGSELFANAMGTGIDVDVVRRMRRSPLLPGGAAYVAALLRALAGYRPIALDLRLQDGRGRNHVLQRRIMNLAVCNGSSIGGSFRICPDARPDDGLLDVCIVGEMPLWRNARLVPRVLKGTHVGQRGVDMHRAVRLHLARADGEDLWFQLDGELRRAPGALEIETLSGALNVIRAMPAQ